MYNCINTVVENYDPLGELGKEKRIKGASHFFINKQDPYFINLLFLLILRKYIKYRIRARACERLCVYIHLYVYIV